MVWSLKNQWTVKKQLAGGRDTGNSRFSGVPDTGILHFNGVQDTGDCAANPWYPGHQHFKFHGVQDTGKLHFTGILDTENSQFTGVPDIGNSHFTGVRDPGNWDSRCPGHRQCTISSVPDFEEFFHNGKTHDSPVSGTQAIWDSPVSQTPGNCFKTWITWIKKFKKKNERHQAVV